MCGFRVYPVRETLVVASTGQPGAGMEFDTEILVRAHWAGLPVRFTPTPVRYPVEDLPLPAFLRQRQDIGHAHATVLRNVAPRAGAPRPAAASRAGMTAMTLPLAIDLSASVALTVPFHDADPAGVAWHGNYFRYFDAARCALLDKIDYGYRRMMDGGLLLADCQVRGQVRSRAAVRLVHHGDVAADRVGLPPAYRLRDPDVENRRTTTGETIQVAVSAATGEMHVGAPEVLRERLREYLRRQGLRREHRMEPCGRAAASPTDAAALADRLVGCPLAGRRGRRRWRRAVRRAGARSPALGRARIHGSGRRCPRRNPAARFQARCPPGYLLGTRRLGQIDGHFRPGTTLVIHVTEILSDASGLGIFACRLDDGERSLSCELTVYRPPASSDGSHV